jgi:hypothetical protein
LRSTVVRQLVEVHGADPRPESPGRRLLVLDPDEVGASMRHGIRRPRLVVVSPEKIPRTTSGETLRAATLAAIMADELRPLGSEVESC